MYQPPKCIYSHFSKALEFYFRVFFPVSIFKVVLNAAEIRTVQMRCVVFHILLNLSFNLYM